MKLTLQLAAAFAALTVGAPLSSNDNHETVDTMSTTPTLIPNLEINVADTKVTNDTATLASVVPVTIFKVRNFCNVCIDMPVAVRQKCYEHCNIDSADVAAFTVPGIVPMKECQFRDSVIDDESITSSSTSDPHNYPWVCFDFHWSDSLDTDTTPSAAPQDPVVQKFERRDADLIDDEESTSMVTPDVDSRVKPVEDDSTTLDLPTASTPDSNTLYPRLNIFPPAGGWSWRTQCVIDTTNRGMKIWQIQKWCGIQSNRDRTNNYDYCMAQAQEEGVSGDDAFVRCEGFRGFG